MISLVRHSNQSNRSSFPKPKIQRFVQSTGSPPKGYEAALPPPSIIRTNAMAFCSHASNAPKTTAMKNTATGNASWHRVSATYASRQTPCEPSANWARSFKPKTIVYALKSQRKRLTMESSVTVLPFAASSRKRTWQPQQMQRSLF